MDHFALMDQCLFNTYFFFFFFLTKITVMFEWLYQNKLRLTSFYRQGQTSHVVIITDVKERTENVNQREYAV